MIGSRHAEEGRRGRTAAENLRRARTLILNAALRELPLEDEERASLELELVELQRSLLRICRRLEELAPEEERE